jgi:FtsZ-binding cell division protein ZapB
LEETIQRLRLEIQSLKEAMSDLEHKQETERQDWGE